MINQSISTLKKDAVVLVSGGLDSTTVLAWACRQAYGRIVTLSFDYGQRHRVELVRAKQIAQDYKVWAHHEIKIPTQIFASSALVGTSQSIEKAADVAADQIPSTYVPCRNLVFLSYAGAMAETLMAQGGSADILLGINSVDYGNYPDCRPEFLAAFEQTVRLASKACVEGRTQLNVLAPLMNLSKADIINLGLSLDVDYQQTVSCYQADDEGLACGECLSCDLRRKGFLALGVTDSTRYQKN